MAVNGLTTANRILSAIVRFRRLSLNSEPPARTFPLLQLPVLCPGFIQDGNVAIGIFRRGKEVIIAIAKLPFRRRLVMGCQPNPVGVVPFLPLLLSSVQHMRAPVAAENRRNSQAATWSSY
jgi:hypothetical protein